MTNQNTETNETTDTKTIDTIIPEIDLSNVTISTNYDDQMEVQMTITVPEEDGQHLSMGYLKKNLILLPEWCDPKIIDQAIRETYPERAL